MVLGRFTSGWKEKSRIVFKFGKMGTMGRGIVGKEWKDLTGKKEMHGLKTKSQRRRERASGGGADLDFKRV